MSNTVSVNKNVTNVITVSAQGPQGIQGVQGPSGSQGAGFNSSSYTTTSSFNTFTGSYQTDSSSFNTRITSLTSATSSYVQNSQTGSFVSNNQTSSFVTNSRTGSFATTGSNVFKGNQTISGSTNIYVPYQTAYGLNENPANNNVFFAYPPLYPDTVNVQIGWTAVVDGGGTYTVSNVQPDTPFAPFTSITLDDPGLTLGYRVGVTFSRESRLWSFNNDGTTNIPSTLNLSGSIDFGNSHSLQVDNLGGLITLTNNAGQGLRTSHALSGRSTIVGDYANTHNSTKLIVDDDNQLIAVTGSLFVAGSINSTNVVYCEYYFTGSYVDDSSQEVTLAGVIVEHPNFSIGGGKDGITVSNAGVYRVSATLRATTSLTGTIKMILAVNLNPVKSVLYEVSQRDESISISCILTLAHDDAITLNIYPTNCGTTSIQRIDSQVNTDASWITIEKLN